MSMNLYGIYGAFLLLLLSGCFLPDANENYQALRDISAMRQKGDFERAIHAGKAYVAKYPESEKGWALLGHSYLAIDSIEPGRECLRKTLEINPDSDIAYVGLGIIERAAGNLEEAKDHYYKAIEVNSECYEAYSSLSVLDILTGKYAEAVIHGEQAWRLDKTDGVVAANLCVAYHLEGNEQRSRYFLNKAEELGYYQTDKLEDLLSGRSEWPFLE